MNDRIPWMSMAALLLALLSAPAHAQSYSDPGLGLGAHVSYTSSAGGEAGSASLGLQIRARLTGAIGIEGLASFRRETYAALSSEERVLTIQMIPVQGSAQIFFFFSRPVQPYLLGGIGYYYVRTRGEGSNVAAGSTTENKFGAHAGAGVEARLARRLTFHADLRRVFIEIDAVKALSATGATDGKSDFWHGTAGLTYHF